MAARHGRNPNGAGAKTGTSTGKAQKASRTVRDQHQVCPSTSRFYDALKRCSGAGGAVTATACFRWDGPFKQQVCSDSVDESTETHPYIGSLKSDSLKGEIKSDAIRICTTYCSIQLTFRLEIQTCLHTESKLYLRLQLIRSLLSKGHQFGHLKVILTLG